MSLKKSVKIKTAPGHLLNLGVKVRNKPRKPIVAAIHRFNQLVEQGLLSNLEFSKEGVISGGKISPHCSKADFDAIRRVVTLSHERQARARSKVDSAKDVDLFHKRQEAQIAVWESKGGFDWVHPAIEEDILKGKNPLFTLMLTERTYGNKLEGLRALASKYIARPRSLTANLKKQLIFFRGEILKQKGKNKIVVASEISPDDKSTTIVRLSGKNVVRETTAIFPAMNIKEKLVVTLLPSGKITWSWKEGKILV